MTIDLGQTAIKLYLDGILPTNSGVRVSLVSNYSNKPIWTNKTATATIYDVWYTLDVTNEDLGAKDVEGFYTLKVEYQQLTWIPLKQYLVKCVNTDINYPTSSYISDNDNNEQIVYFKG